MTEVNQIVRRRIVRRRSNSGSETDGNGSDGRNNGDGGANSTSTIGGGNRDNIASDASNGNENLRQRDESSNTSSGENGESRNEDERIGSDRSGRSDNASDDDGIQFREFGTGNARSSNSGSANGRNNGEGKPKRVYRKRQKAQDAVLIAQDEEDICNIVIAIGDGSANATGYDGFKIYREEAETIARPAARILQRHGAVAETIRTIADPLSLIIACASVAGPRIAGYKMFMQYNGNGVQPPQPNARTNGSENASGETNATNGKVISFTDVNYTTREEFSR